MKIIATTELGVLIDASEDEVKEILTSVNGKRPDKLYIGQKIPAIDYASTITKIKTLQSEYSFRHLLTASVAFAKTIDALKTAVDEAGSIDR